MIKSKFALGNVYGVGVFLMAFLAGGMYFLLHPHMPVHNKFGTTSEAWIPGVIIVGGGLVVLYFYQKKLAFLNFYPDRLEIRGIFYRQTVYKKDITSIDVWGREDIGFAGNGRRASAIVIVCGDVERYVIPDMFYRNEAELRLYLYEHYPAVMEGVSYRSKSFGSEETMPAGEEDEAEKFAGYALLNMGAIFFVGVMVMMIVMLNTGKPGPMPALRWEIPLGMFAILYPLCGSTLFFVKVSGNYLIIRNHFFPWYMRSYRLEEIAGVILESRYGGNKALRVNTKDLHTKKYQAVSLWTKDWQALRQRLSDAGVKVCDEQGNSA